MTVTQKSAYWVMPSGVKDIPYAPVKEMDFTGKKKSQCYYDRNTSICNSQLTFPHFISCWNSYFIPCWNTYFIPCWNAYFIS